MNGRMVSSVSLKGKETVMKAIASVLIALSVLTGIVGPASALDPRTLFDQVERTAP